MTSAGPREALDVVPDAPDILKKILRRKREELNEKRERVPARQLAERAARAPPARPFARALRERVARGLPAVIAELKKASPSKGVFREDFAPGAIAASYERGGATALSVLTDRDFFQGADEFLAEARDACRLPALRKDFVIDAYQVYEARVLGADCILLIVAALGDAAIRELSGLAMHLEMDVLIEVHDASELDRVLPLEGPVLGINNRDLRTFQTRLSTTLDLLERIPDARLVVTESGIHTAEDIALMREHGVHAFLVGEALMRAPDPGTALEKLFG